MDDDRLENSECPLCGRGGVSEETIRELVVGLKSAIITQATIFPEQEHACAVLVLPLPADHWLTQDGFNDPPAPWKCGLSAQRTALAENLTQAARYAVRASTRNGKNINFDPDAMVLNFVIGTLGYWTHDGNKTPFPPESGGEG